MPLAVAVDCGLTVGADGREIAAQGGGGSGRRCGEGDPAARDRLTEGAGDADDQGLGEGGAGEACLVVSLRRRRG